MEIRALTINPSNAKDPARSTVLAIETEQGLGQLQKSTLPNAYIVAIQSLVELAKLGNAIPNLKKKTPETELSRFLPPTGNERVLLIEGNYSSTGRIKQSVCAFLKNARAKGSLIVCFVGVDKHLFAALWKEAERSTTFGSSESSVTKPRQIARTASSSSRKQASESYLSLLPEEKVSQELAEAFVGNGVEVQLVRQLILRAARHDRPVLIQGETGTGKEIVARRIHQYSTGHGRSGPFCPIDCGAIPHNLFESELFGHSPGAYTDARSFRQGIWKTADNGTLFLDEIGELTLGHQAKLLRAIETKKIRPVGIDKEVSVNARIIAATNRDLFAMVRRGAFREDLYQRLRAAAIYTPSLRDYPEDIPCLAEHVWRRITGDDTTLTLPPDILDGLAEYRWPGNVRDLRTVLEEIHTSFDRQNLGRQHLEAVMGYFGHSKISIDDMQLGDAISRHPIDCFRHLRRADEIVLATKAALHPLIVQKKTDKATIKRVQLDLTERLHDFDGICASTLLFNSHVTYNVVHQLKGKLTDFLALLRNDTPKALSYYQQDLRKHFQLTLPAISEETQRVLKLYRTHFDSSPYHAFKHDVDTVEN